MLSSINVNLFGCSSLLSHDYKCHSNYPRSHFYYRLNIFCDLETFFNLDSLLNCGRRCGPCCKRPRRRLQEWSDFCVNHRVSTQSASRCTHRGRETMASVGMSARAAAIVNNARGINGRRLAPVESSSKEDEAQSQKKNSISSKDTEPTQRDFQEERKARRSQSVLA